MGLRERILSLPVMVSLTLTLLSVFVKKDVAF
jgi:hypothetical protein